MTDSQLDALVDKAERAKALRSEIYRLEQELEGVGSGRHLCVKLKLPAHSEILLAPEMDVAIPDTPEFADVLTPVVAFVKAHIARLKSQYEAL